MKAVRLSTDGDIDLIYGRATLVEGGEQVAQRLRQRLEIVRGEWAYDRRRGVPLYDRILVRGPYILATHAVIHEIVTKTPGLTGLEPIQLDLVPATRQLSVTVVGHARAEVVKLAVLLGG